MDCGHVKSEHACLALDYQLYVHYESVLREPQHPPGEVRAAGGRRIATWRTSCTAQSFTSAMDFLVRDHGRLVLQFARGNYLPRCDRGGPVELRARS
ncbi:hypothetical protein NQZ68_013899 [Dissostichus eleginoides]|nr:hypothetical protein NQZ68_013899 [Dissostichus eleginoides]